MGGVEWDEKNEIKDPEVIAVFSVCGLVLLNLQTSKQSEQWCDFGVARESMLVGESFVIVILVYSVLDRGVMLE